MPSDFEGMPYIHTHVYIYIYRLYICIYIYICIQSPELCVSLGRSSEPGAQT